MRTTLVLEDQLFKSAKREAGKEHTTLSEVVNRALRRHLMGKTADEKPVFYMPVFGEPSGLFHHTSKQLAELRDEGR